MSISPRAVHAGDTAEQRRHQRRAALLDAAMTIVADGGWAQLTIDRVCEQAGLIRGYFYESFPDLDTLTAELVDHVATGILAGAPQSDKPVPLPELAHTVITALVDHIAEDPRRARVLFGEMAATGAAARYRQQTIHRLATIFAAEVRSLGATPTTGPADDPIVDLSAALLVNGTGHIILYWADATTPLPRVQLVHTLTKIWTNLSLGILTDINTHPETQDPHSRAIGPHKTTNLT